MQWIGWQRRIFRTGGVALMLVSAIWLSACGGAGSAGEGDGMIAIVGGRLETSLEAEPIPFSVVVVENGKIKAAGAQATTPVPKDAETIQGAGLTIYPVPYNATIEVGGPANLMLQDSDSGLPRGIMSDGKWVN